MSRSQRLKLFGKWAGITIAGGVLTRPQEVDLHKFMLHDAFKTALEYPTMTDAHRRPDVLLQVASKFTLVDCGFFVLGLPQEALDNPEVDFQVQLFGFYGRWYRGYDEADLASVIDQCSKEVDAAWAAEQNQGESV